MLQYKNPLLDEQFLIKLNANREREVYAKITALTFQESPVELIEGRVTQGSINIDGASAVRRTCNLTITTEELNINDFYWGLKSKFKLEIGLKNTVDTKNYPDIIWFPQGIYVITNFNTSYSTNNYLITISGRDKMVLVNGELGGSLNASIDFGVEEYYDIENNMTTFTKVPIKTIIREALHAYVLEPYHNIVINDLDETAVELLEYRGDTPLYLLSEVESSEFRNFTDEGTMKVGFYIDKDTEPTNYFELQALEENGGFYDSRVELAPEAQPTGASVIVFQEDGLKTPYTVAKLEYGQTAGYRKTELVYAGDLISNIGEPLTSIFDKIKNMLGNYEYFYDLDGRFIFQRKKIYTNTTWNGIYNTEEEIYAEDALLSSTPTYRLEGNDLITSFNNAPNLANLKNDYSIWGARKSATDEDIPIHYRYAIDYKPTQYTTLNITEDDIKYHNQQYGIIAPLTTQTSVKYTDEEYDWREIIYQMALDYFKYNQLDCYSVRLAEANAAKNLGEESFYQNGVTGYEQYYTDLQGFWRQLYNPNPEPYYEEFYVKNDQDIFEYKDVEGNIIDLFVSGRYEEANPEEQKHEDILQLIQVNDHWELQSWIDAIPIPEYDDEKEYEEIHGDEANIKEDKYSKIFYIKDRDGNYVSVKWSTHKQYKRNQLFVKDEDEEYRTLTHSIKYGKENSKNLYYHIKDDEYHSVLNLEDDIKSLYVTENKYYRCLFKTDLNYDGTPTEEVYREKINYRSKGFAYIVDEKVGPVGWTMDLINDPANLNFWFDFLDAESELGQFSIPAIGDRAKAINDTDVTAIYFRQVPNLIFTTYEDYVNSDMSNDTGYNVVFVTGSLENMFYISSQGKSAQDRLDELLYNHTYCIESVTIQAVPIYHLQPNTRIFVRDENSKIDGEYIVSKISIPLTYNGIMSINATKAPVRIY